MADRAAPIGKAYAPTLYAVGREKVREFALATGETNPLHLELEAARAAGHRDLVAPPMFAVVFCGPAIAAPLFDPEVGIDLARMVHGGQEFRWGPLVVAGDEITTAVRLQEVSERERLAFFGFESVSTNQDGDTVCVGTWTEIVRG